jgi:antitoxin component HigA of HigAB toxin-antitoxin module/biotin operon repressor
MTAAEHQSYSDLLHQIQPRPIRTKGEYRAQLEWLEYLMGLPPSRHTSTMIEMLSMTIGAYEAQQFPIADAPPEMVLDHLIQNSSQTSATIARDLGIAPSTLSNYRIGRRKLTIDSVNRIAQYFKIPPNVFLGRPKPRSATGGQEKVSSREALDQEVLDILESLGGEAVSAPDIRAHLDITAAQLRASLNRLIECGEVAFSGRARGTRYSLA